MTIEHLIAFNVALAAAIISPGPALLVAIRTTLSSGRGSGIAIGLGLGLMAATWTFMALIGLETIFLLFPLAYAGVKVVGALYLMYIAWKMWAGSRDPVETQGRPAKRAFRRGFLINLLNPKSVLFSAAVLVVVFPANMNAAENAIVVLNHLLIEFTFYTCLAFAMSTTAVSDRYFKAKTYLDRGVSIILGTLGVKILFDVDQA